MLISYNGLWKIMADKKLQKKDLTDELKISSATVAKMGKGESVSLNVLIRICQLLDCNIGDIVSIEEEENIQ
jgi:DNA-binding Xre family transcriptional regulator